MTLALMAHNLDLQARADRLARLEPDALRREAVEAARDLNRDALWALVEAFLVTRGGRGARVSKHTLESYQIGVQTFLDWAQPNSVSLLRPRANDGFRYARFLEAQGLSPSSVRVRLAAARSLFSALRWAEATQAAPFTDVKTAADPVPRWEKRKPYADEDVAALLAIGGMQDAVIILLGAHCGLRNSEMLTLLRKDVHLDVREPYITVTGKRSKRQDVALSRSAAAALRTWLAATPGVAPYVLSIRTRQGLEKAVKRLCREANVQYEGREVHGLRHSAGTKVFTVTQDLLAVRDTLRHRDVTSSEIYVNYARAGKKKVNADW
ncbi:tyrosine-type recombinase/integrase [Deinococcus multiflagellatus]|uniref:Tyrosine-type recombinase/integrase n=1 Tax=Deinococcus multiflagellatus TaxID=1656887 RepID=A0ABW1ZU60_9DEIO|nr:tyrosine-type recombinase/integrase [Deinococcus multiflagellatus]MBZ9715537.1 tyrosine-type recombinase/integrase [Deinococcus multiflagellatus]